MGQVPPKYFYPSAPYGGSEATNSLAAVQPLAQNPQQPLLPPNFTGGASPMGQAQAQQPLKPLLSKIGNPLSGLFG